MSFGGQRHVADIYCDNLSKEGQSVIGLQMGTNKGASQKGMSFGGQRHVADIQCGDVHASKEDQAESGLGEEMGANEETLESDQNFDESHDIEEAESPDMMRP